MYQVSCVICSSSSKYVWKLDGVGPIDNRPSTDKLHHFVKSIRKEKEEKNLPYWVNKLFIEQPLLDRVCLWPGRYLENLVV